MDKRKTIVVHGALARAHIGAWAAKEGAIGLQILTFEAVACRLAGGFTASIDDESLRDAIQSVLPSTALGELDGIKDLPGMVAAASETLRKAWRSGVDLQAEAANHPRIAAVTALETAVLAKIPPSKLRPGDIVEKAEARLDLAKTLFGSVRIVGITGLSPVWQPLLHALAKQMPVVWEAGPRAVPEWLDASLVTVERAESAEPERVCVSAANARHEAIEAMRWARRLIASGDARPEEIAIAAAIPADYDDEFFCLRADANIDLHFVHHVKVTTTPEGQAAAALADALLRGASQSRIRRLSRRARGLGGLFDALPDGWTRVLPLDAPLSSPTAWRLFLDGMAAGDWPDSKHHADDLRAILNLLDRGASAAKDAGERILGGRARAIWRKALENGPAASIDATLETLKTPDGLEPSRSVCWMSAEELAASPRPYVRLLGLNSGRWPRGRSEDRLLADHVIDADRLDPLPPAAADRRDFATILATTAKQVVLSRARRDGEGRLLGRSPLLHGFPKESALRRNAAPVHAFSETDRLAARPTEFAKTTQAIRGLGAWADWNSSNLTPHDGIVRADHPAITAVLARVQSASSLRTLLRNPLGFVWRYGLHLREPAAGSDPLILDALKFGDLVHRVLENALIALEADGGFAASTPEQVAEAVAEAAGKIASKWAASEPLPPTLIWEKTLEEATELARRGLLLKDPQYAGGRSFCEVPFGGAEAISDGEAPWDTAAPVEIPGAGFRISGRIDRLHVAADAQSALVRDYKTGRTPKKPPVIGGGKELQRCLYAYAVRSLLDDGVKVEASLFFLRGENDLRLADPPATMERLAECLRLSRASLLSGAAAPGTDAADDYDDLAFALPANAKHRYVNHKMASVLSRLGDAALVWGVE